MSSLKVCYQSVFVESLKFYFRPSLHIFQHFLWKLCPTPGACIKPGWLPQRPLYHKVNLLGYVAQRPLCYEVNLPRCSKSSGMWRLAALFHHDLWYFQHQTNEHFSSVYVINWAKLINQPTEVPLKSLQSTHSTKLLEKVLTWATHTHSTEGFDDSLETCEIERCSVSEPVFKHNSLCPRVHQPRPQGTVPWL